MVKPVLYGADYSVYVRIARMTLAEKGVDYGLVPVDVFSPQGIPAWYRERQPFGRIPAFEHGDFRLFETSAITRYIDEAFDGPSLQPSDPQGRARLTQIAGLLDSYAYRAMVWDIYVERVSKPRGGTAPDERRIAAALPTARTVLTTLAGLKRPGTWLLGDTISLADLHAAAILAYFVRAREGEAMLANVTPLVEWWKALSSRASFIATEPEA